MKFLILSSYGSHIIEAEDFSEAASVAYDYNAGYDNVNAIIKLPEDQFVKGTEMETIKIPKEWIEKRLSIIEYHFNQHNTDSDFDIGVRSALREERQLLKSILEEKSQCRQRNTVCYNLL